MVQWVKNHPAVQETWFLFLAQENPLEKGMATHPTILAWKIPWAEKSGRLQYMVLPRVERDYTKLTLFFFFSFTFHGGGSGEVRIIFPEERTIHKENTLFEDES